MVHFRSWLFCICSRPRVAGPRPLLAGRKCIRPAKRFSIRHSRPWLNHIRAGQVVHVLIRWAEWVIRTFVLVLSTVKGFTCREFYTCHRVSQLKQVAGEFVSTKQANYSCGRGSDDQLTRMHPHWPAIQCDRIRSVGGEEKLHVARTFPVPTSCLVCWINDESRRNSSHQRPLAEWYIATASVTSHQLSRYILNLGWIALIRLASTELWGQP